MSMQSIFQDNLTTHRPLERQQPAADPTLAASITRAASSQTYYTIRFLVDRGRVANAYRAYSYFRWLDDALDGQSVEPARRGALVGRQQELVELLYNGSAPRRLTREERLLADLVHSDPDPASGLHTYITRMMDVMAFDANRRERLITARELDDYSLALATAVTEALHYFIGHDSYAPNGARRYHAVIAAHITHMLRDAHEDVAAGYYNVPQEILAQHGLNVGDFDAEPYRAWVRERVEQARACFASGRAQLAQVASRRCRLAGYAYMARFEGVLTAIERDGYRLRANYEECKSFTACCLAALSGLVRS